MAERITITIETGNAAFVDTPASEIAQILKNLALNLQENGMPAEGKHLRDSNGNKVGTVCIEEIRDGN